MKLLIFALFTISIAYPHLYKWARNVYRKSSYKVKKDLESKENIVKVLANIGIAVNASRVAIINYEGQTASMFHEWISEGTGSIINFFQKIRTSPLATMLLELERTGLIIVNKNSSKDLVMIHKAIGISTSYKWKLYTSISQGVLVVAFENDNTLDPKHIQYIDEQLMNLRLLYFKTP